MIDLLPAAPDPATDTPQDFNKKAAALVLAQKVMVPQINSTLASMNTLAAGGAYAIPYSVDLTSIADADPTAGLLRFNAAAQNVATTLYMDLLGADGIDYTAILDQLDASTSSVKCSLRVVKMGDPTKFLTFSVMGRTTASGYRKLTLVNTGGSAASPFAQGDGVVLQFSRTGDKGDVGVNTIPMVHVREEQVSGNGATAGTSISSSLYRRALNTVKQNDVSGASLANNQLTLPAGKYLMRAKSDWVLSVPSSQYGGIKTSIYNVTDSVYVAAGPVNVVANMNPNSTLTLSSGVSEAIALITLTSAKTFEVRSYNSLSAATVNGWGFSGNQAGTADVFTDFIVEKIG